MQDNDVDIHARYAAQTLARLSSQSVHALVVTVLLGACAPEHAGRHNRLLCLQSEKGWHAEWKQAKRRMRDPLLALADYARFVQSQL